MIVEHPLFRALRHDRRAVTALEYGYLAAIILAVIMLGFTFLGTSLQAFFEGFVALLT